MLDAIKRETALIRGTFFGTMLRNEIFDFSQIGTFIERADNTARILDVKYYVLLPSISWVGSSLDNYQWESILRSVSAHRSYRWVYEAEYKPTNIADYLILNCRMPRSLAFCYRNIAESLRYLARGVWRAPCPATPPSTETLARLEGRLDQGRCSTPACTNSSTPSSPTTTGWATRSPRTTGSTRSMRLKITHRTEYRYDEPVNYALQRLRLVPCSGATQKVRSWTLSIEGAREEVRFSDHFENDTRLISVSGDRKLVGFEASGEVETYNKAGVTGFHRGFAPLWLFRRDTPLTLPDEAARALAAVDRRGRRYCAPAPADGRHPRARHQAAAATQAGEAGKRARRSVDGAGAAGDGAAAASARITPQIFIAAARLLGFPARYVSGYLMPDGVAAEAASHAWAEAHVAGLGWVGFDVANDMSPDETYVRLATGRDHREAMPVSGIRLGQTEERLAMSVTVEQ